MNNYEEWEQLPCEFPPGIDEGTLTRMKQAMEAIRCPLRLAPSVVLVAGTNGKGSACKVFEDLALATGKRIGTLTSPHLLSPTERIRIQGQPVTEPFLLREMSLTQAVAEKFQLNALEWLTLTAFRIFRSLALDLVVLEASLGGRHAPINVALADLSIITGIDYDHLDFFGETREHIAYEKAGILRYGKTVVVADKDPPATLLSDIEELKNIAYIAGKDWDYQAARRGYWVYHAPKQLRSVLPIPNLPVPSVGAALMGWGTLFRFPDETRLSLLMRQLSLPGHFQRLHGEPTTILDVANNPQSIRLLFRKLMDLEESYDLRGWAVICAMEQKKLIEESLAPLSFSHHLNWYFPHMESEYIEKPDCLACYFPEDRVEICENAALSLHQARLKATMEQKGVVAFGSYALIGKLFEITGTIPHF